MHVLVSRQKGYKRTGIVESFDTYGEALAAYEAVGGFELDLAVRDADDPAWQNVPVLARGERYGGEWTDLANKARWAARDYRYGVVNQLALDIINDNGARGASFGKLEQLLREAMANKGFKVKHYSVTEILKAKVLIGRCWECDRAYWLTRKQGPLNKAKCSTCGSQLRQTTLSLRKVFHRLPVA